MMDLRSRNGNVPHHHPLEIEMGILLLVTTRDPITCARLSLSQLNKAPKKLSRE
jgi:hypothetical protein